MREITKEDVIYALHDIEYNPKKNIKLRNVIGEMEQLGPPELRAIRGPDGGLYALEGTHRLAGAQLLGVAPKLKIYDAVKDADQRISVDWDTPNKEMSVAEFISDMNGDAHSKRSQYTLVNGVLQKKFKRPGKEDLRIPDVYKKDYISFPSEELDAYNSTLLSNGHAYTTRAEAEVGKYKPGAKMQSPLGKITIESVQRLKGKHPFDSELTDAQRKYFDGKEYDFVKFKKSAAMTRYTDENGIGVYEAAMNQATSTGDKKMRALQEQQLLQALAESWELPNPGKLKYKPGITSYFTPEGDAKFREKHLPILQQYVSKILNSTGSIGSPVYSDEYQIIGAL